MYLLLLPLLLSCPQDTAEIQQRADDLEQVRQELNAKIDALADELERRDLGELAPSELTRVSGMGRSASKIYSRDQGTSIGGYGEYLYNLPAGANNTFDALRGVLYVGHRFDEHWLVNTEIEIEHGSTSESGSASLEFGYVEYLPNDAFAVRGGLLLVPMGLVNENHEPTAYLPVSRPKVEQVIMPSTWREMGLGAWGRTGSLEWHTYVVNGLAGENFDESGLRGGRQKGSKADAEDLAFVQRLDWSLSPGLVLGTSFYVGNSAGSNEDLGGSLGTQIFEVHGTWEEGPWSLQALATQAEVDGAQEFNQGFLDDLNPTNPSLANTLHGAYLQVGYNLLANTSSSMALSPYVRYETLDTQADLPSNAVANPKSDEEILTFGIALKPTDGVVIKLDYASSDQNGDRMALLIGYSF
jgi:hypothetical protein